MFPSVLYLSFHLRDVHYIIFKSSINAFDCCLLLNGHLWLPTCWENTLIRVTLTLCALQGQL